MGHMDRIRERVEALEQQTNVMAAQTCTVERRLRWWRGIACGLVMLMLLSLALPAGQAVSAPPPSGGPTAARLVTGLDGGAGSTLGPGGALYVTEGAAGRISRVDPQTGEVTTVASGLPKPGIPGYPFGGAVDLAFLGTTAYVLVAVVGPSDVVGIYRVDGPDRFTVIADLGTFSAQNPPRDPVFDPRGGQYALEPYGGGFLVTDGHHNRVLRATLDGEVSEVIAFGNTVPTGLAVSGNTVYLAEAGPVPHRPEDGKVVAFELPSPTATEVASGASLLVDVEVGRGCTLYALSQGDFPADAPEGAPALPNTGALLRVNGDGTFTVITAGLDRPTSLEFIGTTAYVVTLTGEIWTIDGVSDPPHGVSR
jgi:sugar lactone lactonase YvrE